MGASGALRQDQHVGKILDCVAVDSLSHEVHRSTAFIVLFGDGGVTVDHDASQQAFTSELAQDLGGQDLADNAGELICGSPAPDKVLLIFFRWQIPQLLPEELPIHFVRVRHPAISVDSATNRFLPAMRKGLDRIGMTVEVDNRLLFRWHSVGGVMDGPPKIAKGVEADVSGTRDSFELEDLVAEEFETRTLVIGGAAKGITPLLLGALDIVGWNAHHFTQQLDGSLVMPPSQFPDPLVHQVAFLLAG